MRHTDALAAYLSQNGLTYRDYLLSEHWRETKARYRESGMPQKCIACGEARIDLHHVTYERLGKERLGDLMPLCRVHHEAFHDFDEQTKGRGTLFEAFLHLFGFTEADAVQALRPFSAAAKRGANPKKSAKSRGKPKAEKWIPARRSREERKAMDEASRVALARERAEARAAISRHRATKKKKPKSSKKEQGTVPVQAAPSPVLLLPRIQDSLKESRAEKRRMRAGV